VYTRRVTLHFVRIYCVSLAFVACGPTPGGGAEDPGGTAESGSTAEATTAESTTAEATTAEPTTAALDGSTTDAAPGGCPSGWELPTSITAMVNVFGPGDEVFDPAAMYPDGTSAACVRWDGADLAGVRLAFGPAVGDAPRSLLEVVVSAGEGKYSIDGWPPPPGAYDGLSATYTVADAGGTEQWDLVSDEGLGSLDATWIPGAPGEHIVMSAKLTLGHTDDAPQVGFDVDAVVGVGAPLTCAEFDAPDKCLAAGCAGWLHTHRVADLQTCELVDHGECTDTISLDPEEYDSAYWKLVDGVVELRRVGGEGCHFSGPEHPAEWDECDGGPDDPPECGCVCAGGQCPGDSALDLLEACGLPEPCADLVAVGGSWGPGEDCLYAAMGADEPAVLRVRINLGDQDLDNRVYLRGDGTATWLQGECDISCLGSCDDRDFGVSRSCSAREPAFFAACAAAQEPDMLAGCHDVAAWFTDCTVAPPACP
jgi:hypothetical protein